METSPGTFILLDYLICFYFKMKYAFLESILQTNLTTPAAVVIAIALVSISTGESVNTTSLIINRRIVGAEAITIGMTPILVQQVAHVEDIESQLDGVNLTSYLEAVLLTEVNIEMMLEWQVICITLVVLATVLAEVRILCNPLLQHLTLHLLGELIAMVIAKHALGEGIIVILGFLETHLVNLCIGWDVEQVITPGTILVHVTIIIIGVR